MSKFITKTLTLFVLCLTHTALFGYARIDCDLLKTKNWQLETVSARTNALGYASHSQYDALNRITATTDPLNNTSTMAYDDVGNLTALVNPLGIPVFWGGVPSGVRGE